MVRRNDKLPITIILTAIGGLLFLFISIVYTRAVIQQEIGLPPAVVEQLRQLLLP